MDTLKDYLTIEGLRVRLGGQTILDGVDLKLAQGETLVLLGRSGCGKSTLLRVLAGLIQHEAGSIQWNNSSEAHRVAMVFQDFQLFPHLSLIDNVMLAPLRALKRPYEEVRLQATELLKRVGLADRINHFPSEVSGGQKQRAAIARALAIEPSLLLLDEPTSALDPELKLEVLQVLEDLSKNGMPMILVTHEIGFARRIAHRVAFMDEGRVAAISDPENFFKSPASEKIRSFLDCLDHYRS